MRNSLRILTLAALAVMAACATDQTRDDTGTAGAAAPSAAPTSSPTSGAAAAPAAGMPSARVLYFDFDSAELKPEGAALADAWARYLAANPGTRVRLEGHADERGTREYNVGLGERRGNSVLRALTSRGVSERQLSVSSFGEERPVATGHDEGAWAQNRRVEIVR